MKKRILALALCLLLIVAVLPISAFAATTEEQESEEQRISDQIADFYKKIVRATGVYNLEGWCGLMAGWELYLLGVTEQPMTYNGNDQFDAYRHMDMTDTGHKVTTYEAGTYTMEEALNTITRCGTMDAYNIMAGFQKTRTAAGQLWGHVTVIHAVLDGNVYYTEGFDTDYGLKPEMAQVCSIEEWADLYETWTTFEGMVDFGTKAYIDFCTYYSADLFVISDQAAVLYSQPGSPDMTQLRTTVPGERLHAIGLYENPEGQRYYQIDDGDAVCYVAADGVKPFRFNYTDVTIQDAVLPEKLEAGADFEIAGNIYSVHNRLRNIGIEILDNSGTAVQKYNFEKNSCFFDLSRKSVNQAVDLAQLPEGNYTCRVYADMTNHYVEDGVIAQDQGSFVLVQQPFAVGEGTEAEPKDAQSVFAQTVEQGWNYRQGAWYYYDQGTPRTGWFCENGLDYFLREDGTAVTGWQNINGKDRFFSATGVMRTGWMDTENGKMYLLRNGVAAIGWRNIGEDRYFFDKNGIMLTDCQVADGNVTYYLQPDGKAVKP